MFRGREANGDCLCVSYNLSILGDGEFSGTAHGWGRGDVAHASQFLRLVKTIRSPSMLMSPTSVCSPFQSVKLTEAERVALSRLTASANDNLDTLAS